MQRRNDLDLLSPESIAGLAALASFYTGDEVLLRLSLQICVLATVALALARDFGKPQGYAPLRNGRWLGFHILLFAFVGMYISFAILIYRGPSINDLALFLLQCVAPVMILFSTKRANFALAVGTWAVLFATIDLIANLFAIFGFLDLRAPARVIGGQVVYTYLGLTGNILSAGFIAFIAICRLALSARQSGKVRWMSCIFILIILFSLELIQARRYIGLSIVALGLFQFWTPASRIGLHWVAVSVASIFLWLNFGTVGLDSSNSLRSLLLRNGIDQASNHLIIGRGPTYLVLDDVNATFEDLAAAGVTESQILDFAISYGALAAILLIASLFLILSTRQGPDRKFHAIVLTCLTAELFFGGTLTSFAGTLIFYGALGACLEAYQNNKRNHQQNRRYAKLVSA